jgi:hypothetical protein
MKSIKKVLLEGCALSNIEMEEITGGLLSNNNEALRCFCTGSNSWFLCSDNQNNQADCKCQGTDSNKNNAVSCSCGGVAKLVSPVGVASDSAVASVNYVSF